MGSDAYHVSRVYADRYFNPRSRMGSDTQTGQHDGYHRNISIHAPAWGATKYPMHVRWYTNISIHAPAWGATFNGRYFWISRISFQSTLPHGERLKMTEKELYVFLFQSTLPHGERLYWEDIMAKRLPISIHAPAWGATDRHLGKGLLNKISIHAPAWGATRRSTRYVYNVQHFNPRSRMGSDIGPMYNGCRLYAFQSTLPHGERLTKALKKKLNITFQSTLPHGERQLEVVNEARYTIFQSTLPHGERQVKTLEHQRNLAISIHAPAWGATCIGFFGILGSIISIHAPAWGATSSSGFPDPEALYFNPRSRMGSDSKNMRFLLCFCNFH